MIAGLDPQIIVMLVFHRDQLAFWNCPEAFGAFEGRQAQDGRPGGDDDAFDALVESNGGELHVAEQEAERYPRKEDGPENIAPRPRRQFRPGADRGQVGEAEGREENENETGGDDRKPDGPVDAAQGNLPPAIRIGLEAGLFSRQLEILVDVAVARSEVACALVIQQGRAGVASLLLGVCEIETKRG